MPASSGLNGKNSVCLDLVRLQIPISMLPGLIRCKDPHHLRAFRAAQEGKQGHDEALGPWSDPCRNPHARKISYILKKTRTITVRFGDRIACSASGGNVEDMWGRRKTECSKLLLLLLSCDTDMWTVGDFSYSFAACRVLSAFFFRICIPTRISPPARIGDSHFIRICLSL